MNNSTNKTKKNDFVEIKFIGKVKGGEVFDTNIKSEAEKIGLRIEEKPTIVCIGQEMVINGFDKALPDKEIGKSNTLELEPKDAFNERKSSLVKLIPLKSFIAQKISPRPGMTLALDNMLVKIINVSGGRVLTDFNNPLSGKNIIYEFTITRKIEEEKEKVESIIDYFLRTKANYEIKEKEIQIEVAKEFSVILDIINKKFENILGKKFIIKQTKQTKESDKKDIKKSDKKDTT